MMVAGHPFEDLVLEHAKKTDAPPQEQESLVVDIHSLQDQDASWHANPFEGSEDSNSAEQERPDDLPATYKTPFDD